MTPFRRALAVAVVLLSQVASGFAVLCEEGSGGRMFEVFPGVCCDETVDGAPAAAQAPAPEPASAPDAPHDCGACRDEALTRLLPGHGDERELTLPPAPQDAARCSRLALRPRSARRRRPDTTRSPRRP